MLFIFDNIKVVIEFVDKILSWKAYVLMNERNTSFHSHSLENSYNYSECNDHHINSSYKKENFCVASVSIIITFSSRAISHFILFFRQ